MDTPAEIAVPRNHGRIQWLAISSILCVVVGIWMLRGATAPADAAAAGSAAGSVAASGTASLVAGWLSIAFGGLCGIWAIRRLRDKRPGLLIGSDGLTDHSNITSVGFIPWSDIDRIEAMVVNRQPMLLVHVHNPQPYLERGSGMARTLRNANWRASGTPIVVAAHALAMRGDLLQAEVQRRIDAARPQVAG